ncbi:MAG: DUF4173 domain-containing protein [Clostridia bacterium]|nr:DUF4173 domain-containing protein [Clostridia bacterium]
MTETANLPLERQPRDIRPADRVAVPAVYLLAFGFIYSFLESATVGSWAALTALLIATPLYLRRFDIRLSLPAYLLYALLPLFALPQLLSDNSAVYAVSMAATLFGYLYVVHYLCAGFGRARLPGEAILLDGGKAVFGMPLSEFGAAPAALAQIKGKRVGRTVGLILAGLALALIPTLIVTVLLASADDGFSDLIDDIFSHALPDFDAPLLLVSLFFAIPLCCYVFGHLWACGTHSLGGGVSEETYRKSVTVCRIIPIPMACAAVAPLLIVYLLFFSTQIPYFVGGFTGTLPEGLTYAAYARRGFFELCAVAVIDAGMLVCLNLFTKRDTDRLPLLPRAVSLMLSLSTLILLSTATAKMLLYVDTYGLSRKRVYTLWLMALLAVYFVIQIVRLFVPRLRASALVFAAVVLFVGVFLFADFDRIIAEYNVDAYLSGEMEAVDVDMLSDMSASAVSSLLRLYDEADNTGVRTDAYFAVALFLTRTQGDAMEAYGYGGWEFNFAEARALKLIRSHTDYARFINGRQEFYERAEIINPNR